MDVTDLATDVSSSSNSELPGAATAEAYEGVLPCSR